jgi:hypothetical protein
VNVELMKNLLQKIRKRFLYTAGVAVIFSLVLGCGGGSQLSLRPDGVGSGGTGIVFTGSPSIGSHVTAWNAQGEMVASTYTDATGRYKITLPSTGVYLLRAELQDGTQLHDLVSVSASSSVISNISPVSELVTSLALQADPAQATIRNFSEPDQRKSDATDQVVQLLGPILLAQKSLTGLNASEAIHAILAQDISLNNQGLDGVMDRLSVIKVDQKYRIGTPTAPAIPTVYLRTDGHDISAAISEVHADTYTNAITESLPQLTQIPAALVLKTSTNWESMSLWIPLEQSNSWSLSFETQTLPVAMQWAGGQLSSVHYEEISRPDGSKVTRYLLQGQENQSYPSGSIVSWRLVGPNLPQVPVDISNCRLNNQPCAVRHISAEPSSSAIADFFSAYGQQNPGRIIEDLNQRLDSVPSSPTLPAILLNQPVTPQASDLQLTWDLDTVWVGGYSGILSITNISAQSIQGTSWTFTAPIAFAAELFTGGPWNLIAQKGSNGQYTFTPMSTQADLRPGERAISGYVGNNLADLCMLRTQTDPSVKVSDRLLSVLNGNSPDNTRVCPP